MRERLQVLSKGADGKMDDGGSDDDNDDNDEGLIQLPKVCYSNKTTVWNYEQGRRTVLITL